MTILGFVALIFILVFFGLMVILAVSGREGSKITLRRIPAYTNIQRAIELAVEAGSRLHLSIGRGSITRPESASAFVGLSMLKKMISSASTGDSPPVVTTGDPSLAILAQDTIKSAYQEIGLIDQYKPALGQLTGLTPFSYAAGAIPITRDPKSATSILIGSFGMEVALLTDGCERGGNKSLAGTDDVSAQAILYATADDPLIGEELYAGGAYIEAGPMHIASLQTQDVFRWILVGVVIAGILIHSFGLDQTVTNLIEGLL